jgi:cell division protein FtsN
MAHKDYVARGRASKKKAPPPTKKSIPWLRIIITLALLCGFIYLLWSIKSGSTSVEEQQAEPQVMHGEDPLPELEEEEWEFIKSLPYVTVEIDESEQAVSERRYLMQCGSFRKEEQAQEMKARIAFQGLEAQVRPSDGKTGRWFRVILGPYDLRRSAEKDRHELRRNNLTTCKIWTWNL